MPGLSTPEGTPSELRPFDRVLLGLFQPALRPCLCLQLGLERPEWELAAGLLRRAIAHGSQGLARKDEFAMDWYYPVLVGALDKDAARAASRRGGPSS